jgi:hypothetical protein
MVGSGVLHIVHNIRPGLCWRTPKEACKPECLVATVEHGSGTVIIWTATSSYYAGPIITLHGRTTASDYVDILGASYGPDVVS